MSGGGASVVWGERGRAAMRVYEDLVRQGVIVRRVGNYGLPEHLRISIGTAEENQRLLQALRQVL